MTARRRGACPGLADPLPTGDGLLARLAVTRAIPLDAFAALCRAARAHGNGIIEITARGSIQVRGLTAQSAPAFAAAVEALDVVDAAGGRVLSNPLAGLDPRELFDVSEIAYRLREALVESGLAAKLAPKVSIVIDGGGALHLDAIPCDIRLRAKCVSGGVHFQIAPGTDGAIAAALGTIDAEHAVEAVLVFLKAIAKHGPMARGRDVLPLRLKVQEGSKGARSPAEPIGTHRLRDGSLALGLGLPFGHSDADALQDLLAEARRADTTLVRPAPGRALLLIGVPPPERSSLVAAAERLGIITAAADPRRRVLACAGAPACAAAKIPTRVLAPAIAAVLDEQTTLHISGCAKGCAHPGPAGLTIVGIDGKCGLVRNGRAQDEPTEFVAVGDLPKYFARRRALQEAAHG
jgi:precorrin-3B synthase